MVKYSKHLERCGISWQSAVIGLLSLESPPEGGSMVCLLTSTYNACVPGYIQRDRESENLSQAFIKIMKQKFRNKQLPMIFFFHCQLLTRLCDAAISVLDSWAKRLFLKKKKKKKTMTKFSTIFLKCER